MKNKVCSILVMLFLTGTLYGCAEQTKPTVEPGPLVIESIEPCTEGTVEVYATGVETFEYQGEIDIVNDGRNGETIEIVLKVGDGIE